MTEQKREFFNNPNFGSKEMTEEELKFFRKVMNKDAIVPYIIEFASPFDFEHFRVSQEGCRGNLLSNATQIQVIQFIAIDNYNAQLKQQNVEIIAKFLGGGGHEHAAGFVL